MITLYNFFDDETLNYITSEVESLTGQYRWAYNHNYWDPYLTAGLSGVVGAAPTSDHLTHLLANHLLPCAPNTSKINVQHCLWYPNSGINFHSDKEYTFTASIYLTPNWQVNWGGLFVYGSTDREDYTNLKVLHPTYNSININTEKLFHMVTPVSTLAPRPRHTIQIWGT